MCFKISDIEQLVLYGSIIVNIWLFLTHISQLISAFVLGKSKVALNQAHKQKSTIIEQINKFNLECSGRKSGKYCIQTVPLHNKTQQKTLTRVVNVYILNP